MGFSESTAWTRKFIILNVYWKKNSCQCPCLKSYNKQNIMWVVWGEKTAMDSCSQPSPATYPSAQETFRKKGGKNVKVIGWGGVLGNTLWDDVAITP